MTTIIFLLVVAAIVWRTMTPDGRARAGRAVPLVVDWLKNYGRRELEPFREALRARTRWAFVSPAIVATQAALLVATGGDRHPSILIAWGASFGPLTTNDGWWRLVTAALVPTGFWSFAIGAVALLQVGPMLERLAGPLAVSSIYLTAAASAGLATIWAHPMWVSSGASGGVYGLYGLLLVWLAAGRWYRSDSAIPAAAIKRLAPVSVLFVVGDIAGGSMTLLAALVAVGAGLVLGAGIAGELDAGTASPRRLAVAALAVVAALVASAIPLRGITDVRPELERLLAVEQRTAGAYDAAIERFTKGKATAAEVVAAIEGGVIPDLEAADARLSGLGHVPQEDQQRVADARLYLRLRIDGWRLREEALRRTSALTATAAGPRAEITRAQAAARYRSAMLARGRAETAERAAMEALDRAVGTSHDARATGT